MTLGFIVGRILRELIELAERDADAELVDALHDGGGAATAAEVDAALRQRELFGAAEYPVQRVDAAERPGDDVDVG